MSTGECCAALIFGVLEETFCIRNFNQFTIINERDSISEALGLKNIVGDDNYAPATVNVMLSALRGVLKAAWKLDLLSAEEYQKAIDTDNIKIDTLPTGRDVKALEVKALFETCHLDNEPRAKDVRDAAMLALLYSTGMRRAEAANLAVEDYDSDNGQIKVLSGKGRKDRTVYISGKAKSLVDTWLMLRGQHTGAFWHFIDRWGNIHKERGISSQPIYDMLKTRGMIWQP